MDLMIRQQQTLALVKARGYVSIDEIAAEVGFSEVTYFITCFRKMMGQTPLQYRKASLARNSVLT